MRDAALDDCLRQLTGSILAHYLQARMRAQANAHSRAGAVPRADLRATEPTPCPERGIYLCHKPHHAR